MSMSDKQVQKAGNNAQQMQAEIINITNVSGIDEKRAREIFNEMYAIARKDFTQDAYQCANERVAKFEEALMPKMLKVEGALQKFSDPSFQFLITEAHKTAASTEREADYDLLSELLLHRVKKDKDRKVRVGIKKAIEIVDQVDDDALCALTVAYTIERLFPATGSIIRGLNILENVFSKLCYTNLCQGKEWLDHLEILDAVRLDHISSLKDLDLFYAEQLDGYVCVGIKKESEDYQKALSLLSSGNLPRELLCDHELLEGYVTSNLQQTNTNGYKLQTDKCDVKSAIEFVEKWGESALEYSPTPEYQQRLRSLYGQFVYRLDTNYAKIDRIEHKEIEKFKTHVLNTDFHGMTIKQWSNIFSSKDEAKLEYALKTLL